MKIDDLELGDEVEIQVRTELLDCNIYSYVLKGTVYGNGKMRLVCGHNLHSTMMERAKILSHDRPWHEPEGWRDWPALSINGEQYIRYDRHCWIRAEPDLSLLVKNEDQLRGLMEGRPVVRLWLTDQEPRCDCG